MRWVSAFLVIIATPLVVLAAAAVLPVGWLAAAGALFVTTGAIAVYVSRRQPAVDPLPSEPTADQSTVE